MFVELNFVQRPQWKTRVFVIFHLYSLYSVCRVFFYLFLSLLLLLLRLDIDKCIECEYVPCFCFLFFFYLKILFRFSPLLLFYALIRFVYDLKFLYFSNAPLCYYTIVKYLLCVCVCVCISIGSPRRSASVIAVTDCFWTRRRRYRGFPFPPNFGKFRLVGGGFFFFFLFFFC